MALTIFLRCESDSPSAPDDLITGITPPLNISHPTQTNFTSAAGIVGTNGIESGQADSFGQIRWRADLTNINRLTGSIGFYYRVPSLWGSSSGTFYIRDSSNFIINITVNSRYNGITRYFDFIINNEAGAPDYSILSSLNNMPLNQAMFCTFSWDQPNSLRRIRIVYANGDLFENITSNAAFNPPSSLVGDDCFRVCDGGASHKAHMDNIFVGTAYDDAETFIANRNITSASQYSAGSVYNSSPSGIVTMGSGALSAFVKLPKFTVTMG